MTPLAILGGRGTGVVGSPGVAPRKRRPHRLLYPRGAAGWWFSTTLDDVSVSVKKNGDVYPDWFVSRLLGG